MKTFKRHRGPTEQAADAAVDQARRMLRLATIRAQFPELPKQPPVIRCRIAVSR